MIFDDDLNACAQIVQKGDPVRFRTVMAAPVSVRALLFPLYAFNVEVSRAPWITGEPMIAEMRLQWWHDALEEISSGKLVRRHNVVTPLALVLGNMNVNPLHELIEARLWDCYKDPFSDEGALREYIHKSYGNLTKVAAELLGGPGDAAHSAGYATGVANWLRACPRLEAQHRIPLVDGSFDGIQRLAQSGLQSVARARAMNVEKSAVPAFWPATGIERVLHHIINDPGCVARDQVPEASRINFWIRAGLSKW